LGRLRRGMREVGVGVGVGVVNSIVYGVSGKFGEMN
jgi:hypothetical protein